LAIGRYNSGSDLSIGTISGVSTNRMSSGLASTKFTITSNGNVGIGTATPATNAKLDVSGDVYVTGTGNLVTSGSITSTGNITATHGLITATGASINGNITSTGTISSTEGGLSVHLNAQIDGTTTSTGSITTNGNVSSVDVTASGKVTAAQAVITGGVDAGGVITGGVKVGGKQLRVGPAGCGYIVTTATTCFPIVRSLYGSGGGDGLNCAGNVVLLNASHPSELACDTTPL